jgi:tRNA(fMet)-specific endonuclease VapC
MKYLLDTCTISDFVKGHTAVLARIKQTSPNLLAVSTITCMEVEYGLALNPEKRKKLAPIMQAFFSSITKLSFEEIDANASGSIRAALKAKGQPIGAYDIMIAGTAIARGFTLITSNTHEFRRVNGIQLEDWRA